jgi:N-acetylglucosaminyl-diphospho-decaprenol L-rhamnosyltransferase
MISIVIVNWNSGALLERCVRSLRMHAGNCETIVVDNASDDGSLDFFAASQAKELVIKNSRNRGFAAANNTGWRACSGDPVLFLNPDTACTAGAVPSLAVALSDDPAAAAVGGLLVDSSGSPQPGFNVRAFPTIAASVAELLLLDAVWPQNPWTSRYLMARHDWSKLQEVDQPAAACLMVRRQTLEKIAGFDESFFPAWFEDVDLCKRIKSGGSRILFQPAARFEHAGGSSLRRLTREEFLAYYHGNQIRYFAKHHGTAAAGKIRSAVKAGLLLRAVLSLVWPPDRSVGRIGCWKSFIAAAAAAGKS